MIIMMMMMMILMMMMIHTTLASQFQGDYSFRRSEFVFRSTHVLSEVLHSNCWYDQNAISLLVSSEKFKHIERKARKPSMDSFVKCDANYTSCDAEIIYNYFELL